jgi:hypothetical protein
MVTKVDVSGAPVAPKDPYSSVFDMSVCHCNCRAK